MMSRSVRQKPDRTSRILKAGFCAALPFMLSVLYFHPSKAASPLRCSVSLSKGTKSLHCHSDHCYIVILNEVKNLFYTHLEKYVSLALLSQMD